MADPKRLEGSLIEKIRRLAPERLAQVEDFVDSLRLRDDERRVGGAATKLSETACARVWENPDDDDDYDRL